MSQVPGGTVDLQIRRVTKRFEHGPVAVADFSLTGEAGELLSLRWPSGYGKTTTLRSSSRSRALLRGVFS